MASGRSIARCITLLMRTIARAGACSGRRLLGALDKHEARYAREAVACKPVATAYEGASRRLRQSCSREQLFSTGHAPS